MASRTLSIRRTAVTPLFPLIRKRALDLRPIGTELIDHMRFGGKGSIADHFASQRQYFPSGATRSWRQSQRALRDGGLTLVETGAYRAAWLGQGVGARTRRDRQGVRVGVNSERFPQVNVFQAQRRIRGIAPRRITMNPFITRGAISIVLRYVARGR